MAHGIDAEVGSVEAGKLADLVLWDPAFFGVRPHLVVKGGVIAWAAMGDANASIPTPQPVLPRPMFGAYGAVPAADQPRPSSPPAALEDGLADRLAVARRLVPVADTRGRGKADLPLNDALPRIEVEPDTFTVRIDGEVVEPEPADRAADGPALLPLLSRRHERATALLLLADGRLPAGGHAHSGGLEAAVAAGRVHDLATLEAFLRGRLATAGLVAAAFAAAAAASAARAGDPAGLARARRRRWTRGRRRRRCGRRRGRRAGRCCAPAAHMWHRRP